MIKLPATPTVVTVPMVAALAVWPAQATCIAKATAIATQLSAPLLLDIEESTRDDFSFLLRVNENGIALLQGKSVIEVDFAGGSNRHRRLHGGGRGQSVAKAVGLKAGNIIPTVLDCTAGLARDAFVLASLGCPMRLCERSPLVRVLLQDGLERALASGDVLLHEIIGRMQLLQQDALAGMAALQGDSRPDVIYLDPMFPERQKSAAVKKDMAAFHALVGADEDADALLPLALQTARCRVVVKRPRHAPYLDNCKPDLVLEGDSTRFDIYPLRSMAIGKSSSGL